MQLLYRYLEGLVAIGLEGWSAERANGLLKATLADVKTLGA